MSSSPYAPYDYAWKDRGWTVQNPEVIYPTNTYSLPGMPTDVNLVQVSGHFMEMDSGRGLEGLLRLRINENLVHVPSGRMIPAGPLVPVRFNAEGFTIFLPATDDGDLVAQAGGSWVYYARLTVSGVPQDFAFELPSILEEVNVLDLIATPGGDSVDGGVIYDAGTI